MATPNYGYEKRQRELAKKRKSEEKKQKKQHGDSGQHNQPAEGQGDSAPAGDLPAPPPA